MMKDGTRNLRLTQNHPPRKTAGRAAGSITSTFRRRILQAKAVIQSIAIRPPGLNAWLPRRVWQTRSPSRPSPTCPACQVGKNRQNPVPTPDKSGTPIS